LPPSDSASRRSGYLRSTARTGDRRALDDVMGDSVMSTSKGESGEGTTISTRADVHAHDRPFIGTGPPEGVPVVAVDARPPELEGFSEKVTAWQPLAATGALAAMSSGSQMAGIAAG